MSSIYQKGRDGYFYYQTYVYNENTGKKDKKIFHALKTKNRAEAELKQKKLDRYYLNSKKKSAFWHPTKLKLFSSFLILLIVLFSFYLNDHNQEKVKSFNDSRPSFKESIRDSVVESSYQRDVTEKSNNFDEDSITSSSLKNLNNDGKFENLVPIKEFNYNVIRTEKNSGPFQQIKVFALVDIEIDSLNKKVVCINIKNKFNKYSNIVICLYANNDIGRNLAMNEIGNINSAQRVKNWLALFTYNSVEGEYFDSNPGGYLDAY